MFYAITSFGGWGIQITNGDCVTRWENWLGSLRFLFANVAVSKSRHRLFFYLTKERVKRTEKELFRDFMSKGGKLWKGRVLASFPSVVFHGLLGTCSFWKLFVCLCVLKDFVWFMVTLVSVLKSVIKRFF